MPQCAAGHDSATTDFCDVCGTPLDAVSSPVAAKQPVPPPAEPCPSCGAPRTGRFCEACGHDFSGVTQRPVAPPPPAAGWYVLVSADRDQFRAVMAAGGPDSASIVLPEFIPERRFPLTGPQVRIGRRSVSRGLHPEIDLSQPPEDPGVSHLHAVLLARPDGGWSLLDPGSTNGTTLNDDPTPLPPGVPVALNPGDRVHVGAWTTLTLLSG
ncbi:MAG TPA: FHA domain-containing protein [Pseudonocardiaceae bacterium]